MGPTAVRAEQSYDMEAIDAAWTTKHLFRWGRMPAPAVATFVELIAARGGYAR
jgi:hypothetical protein